MSILDEIRARKEQEVTAREAARPLPALIAMCNEAQPPRRFRDALRLSAAGSDPETRNSTPVKLIAEVKRHSPARGALRVGADAPALAASYAESGAAAISVLTDEHFFHGADADLVAVRDRVAAPILRKDFTISSYQIYEARALGADAILLIVSMLSDDLISSFLDTAARLKMDTLVETHTEDEVRRAVAIGAQIIGINNRDLRTFDVDLGTTERLRSLIPDATTVVSESGILTRADVERAAAAGAQAVLVGEALVTADDPGAKVRELLGLRPSQGPGARGQAPGPSSALTPRAAGDKSDNQQTRSAPTPDPRPPTPSAQRAL